MEQKVIIIEGQYLGDLNKHLEEGWKVKYIAPFTQSIAAGIKGVAYGNYGAYVVLQRKQKVLTENEIKTILATKGIVDEEELYGSNWSNFR